MQRRHRHPAAFTLIELLLVMGVILILIAMLFTGINYVQNSARNRSTKAALESAKALFAEYDAATHLQSGTNYYAGTVVTAQSITVGSTDRTTSAQAILTDNVMGVLYLMPDNKKTLGNLPTGTTQKLINNIALLDGWGNPIFFVPSGGLQNVTAGGALRNIVAPDNRPFFVSAGPDGDISKGDDNIYSFEN